MGRGGPRLEDGCVAEVERGGGNRGRTGGDETEREGRASDAVGGGERVSGAERVGGGWAGESPRSWMEA
ncbi:hypothetical protein [Oryza sativa Japonica Group]|uniref:Uncharacterized protein n=1 Tax=Oryza sativa subsp. japonica TaxID=39947 RepID=Q9FTG8_ORYSJ|nr:hypothetical protein [Oryza sativa Japonica Group]